MWPGNKTSTHHKLRHCYGVVGAVSPLSGCVSELQDLFAFGDVDGKGREARLQHPLGVAWNSCDKMIYVADSYNHKVCVCGECGECGVVSVAW